MADSDWRGEPHGLKVTKVRLPDPSISPFDDGEIEGVVEHLPSCPRQMFRFGDQEIEDWNCELAWHHRELGLAANLRGSVTAPGEYQIQSWGAKYYVWDCAAYEYDGGICLIEADEPPAGAVA